MAGLSISRAWDETKARIAADGKLMMAVALALILLPQAVIALTGPPEPLSGVELPAWINLLVLLATLATLVGQVAIARLAIGPATDVGGAISHGAKRLLAVIGALLLLAIALFLIAVPLVLLFAGTGAFDAAAAGAPSGALGIAVLLLLVLAILIGARFLLIIPVAAAEPGGPIHILKRSWSLAGGHYAKLVGFIILLLIVVSILSLAVQFGGGTLIQLFFDISPFSVGALLYGLLFGALQAAYAVGTTVLLARMYLQLVDRDLADRDSAGVTVPKSGT